MSDENPKKQSDKEKDPTDSDAKDAENYRERWIRTAADFDNFRKRTARDAGVAGREAEEAVLRDLLPVLDSLDSALDSARDAAVSASEPWFEGVQNTRNQMLDVLKRHGAESIDATDAPFDPNLHEAVGTVNLTDRPDGVIADVVQVGYRMLDGRVLRPARVVVVTRGL